MPAKETINILILGETGVGKSTWINAIYYYLRYETLDLALKSKNKTAIIPSMISYTKADGKQVDITIGDFKPDNLNDVGESVTKTPDTYTFAVDDKKFCLIDTPGIGDVRGIEQDAKNFDMIIQHLSHYKKIHGICILLKSNNARLGIVFRFCIGELLTHLHKSAVSNIIFCFTNCRGTFYRPGDTLPSLIKLLKEYKHAELKTDNTFSFDNEAFRLLACIQNGIECSSHEIKAYSESWDNAVVETGRLFKYVSQRNPHNTEDTISVNKARASILKLSKPIVEVQTAINENITRYEDKLGEMNIITKDKESLLNQYLVVKQKGIKFEQIDYPKTVCSHDDCQEIVTVGKSQKRVAKRECHPHCHLQASVGVTNDPRLQGCWCIENGKCIHATCGHTWALHMHITYNLKEYEFDEINPEVEKMIEEKKSQEDILKAAADSYQKNIKDLEAEKNTIITITAKFASFLNAFSITPYNDAIEDLLRYKIEDRKKFGKKKEEEQLQRVLQVYQAQKAIIDDAIEDAKKNDQTSKVYIESPENVEKLIEELFLLPRNGKTIKDIFQNIEKYHFEDIRKFEPIQRNDNPKITTILNAP